MLQLLEMVITVRTNNNWNKTYIDYLGKEMSRESFEEFWYIPKDLESKVYELGYVHAQEKSENALTCHLWLTLRLCAIRS